MLFERRSIVKNGLLLVCFGMWLVFNLWSLERYPAPTCDETFYARTALRYTQAVFAGNAWPPAEGRLFYLPHGRTYWLVLGGFLSLLGRSLFVARSTSLIGWILTALATYWVGWRYTASKRVASWSAGLVSVAWIALQTGHRVRPDMLAAAVSTGMVGFSHIALSRRKPWLYVSLGLATTLSLDVHLIVLNIILPLVVLVAVQTVRNHEFRQLIWYGLGLILGTAAVTLLHMGVMGNLVFSQLESEPTSLLQNYIHTGIGNNGLLGRLLTGIGNTGRFWWNSLAWTPPFFALPQAGLFAGGLAVSVFGRDRNLRMLAFVSLLSILSFSIANSTYQLLGYAIIWVPLHMVMGVAAVFNLGKELEDMKIARWFLPNTLLVGLLLAYVSGDAYLAVTHQTESYTTSAQHLIEDVEPGESILISSLWWWALPDDITFLDEMLLAPRNSVPWWNAVPDDELLSADEVAPVQAAAVTATRAQQLVESRLIDDLRPNYIVDDGVMGCQVGGTLLSEALTFQTQQVCMLVRQVTPEIVGDVTIQPCYGPQSLYTCEWP